MRFWLALEFFFSGEGPRSGLRRSAIIPATPWSCCTAEPGRTRTLVAVEPGAARSTSRSRGERYSSSARTGPVPRPAG